MHPRVDRENGERVVPRTLAHVVLLRTLDHTGSEELLMNLLEPRMRAALRGMETVARLHPGADQKKSERTLSCTLAHVFLLSTLDHTGSEELLINVLGPWTHAAP